MPLDANHFTFDGLHQVATFVFVNCVFMNCTGVLNKFRVLINRRTQCGIWSKNFETVRFYAVYLQVQVILQN